VGNKRKNYLIDKDFQLGFIFRFVVIIIITIVGAFFITGAYYWIVSNVGDLKLDTTIIYNKRDYIKFDGKQVYDYPKEMIQIYEDKDLNGKTVYRCYNPFQSGYKKGDIIENVDKHQIQPVIGMVSKSTTRFNIIFFPLLYTGIALLIIISIFSLFFSHRMAGPIYRLRISLDRMLTGDLDFKIACRKKDFFLNIVDRLERFRQMVVQNNLKPKKK